MVKLLELDVNEPYDGSVVELNEPDTALWLDITSRVRVPSEDVLYAAPL
jgi:hypothetical protein